MDKNLVRKLCGRGNSKFKSLKRSVAWLAQTEQEQEGRKDEGEIN